jgi:transcriptional regulator with XRE-family HTH domain
MGRYGYVPAEPVRQHVARLRALGWTIEQIADAAGVSNWVPAQVARGTARRLWKDRAEAVLSVPAEPRDSHRGVDSTGTRRRVQALAWMGWPCAEIARRAGTTPSSLRTLIQPRRRVSYALAGRVADVYEELSMQAGPSLIAARKARSLGFAPPLAWDDDTIDDPAAAPDRGDASGRGPAWDELPHLIAGGCSADEAARRLGVAVGTVRGRLPKPGKKREAAA